MIGLGKPSLWILVSIALFLMFSSANADNEAVDSVVVTASRLEQPADKLSQTIAIITLEEIERLWAASATEVLRQIPGANVIQQGGRGGVSSILLRGGEPNFTVVLIDGVQVNDPTNTRGGSYDIGNLEQAQIGRIETIFGAMSPVYGSDALSGVVHFMTRGSDAGSDISIVAGTQGYGSASGFYGGSLANIDVGLGAYVTDDDGAVDGASYNGAGLNGNFSAEFADAGTARLSLGYQETESTSFPEDSGGPELAVIRELDTRDVQEARAGLDVGYVFAGRWKTDFWASIYSREENHASPGIAPGVINGVPPNAADTDFDRKQLRASVGTDFSGNISGLLGAEWQNEKGKSAGFIDFGFPVPTDFELDRDTVSAFAEASVELGSIVVQGGIRWDDPDAISSVVTGRLGLLYRFSDGLTELRANWGDGFKAPSFFALAHPIVGNPDLQSETGESVDLGIKRRFQGNSGSFEFVVFRNEYKDLVDFDPDLFINVNRDTVVTKGAEVAVEYAPLDQLNIRAHLTYLDTDVKDDDAILRGRPEWRGGAVIDWELSPNWRWVTSALALDEFYESSVPTGGVWLDGYFRVDTSLTWQATEALSVGLAVDNLFDKDYQEAVGFPAAGIRGRVGAKYRF
jgi:iron complex outermembrane receptor protein/vitamin B12 transporter